MDSRSSVLKTNHLYNTNTRTFKLAGNLTIERYGHVLVKTEDVYVFTVGGADGNSVRGHVQNPNAIKIHPIKINPSQIHPIKINLSFFFEIRIDS